MWGSDRPVVLLWWVQEGLHGRNLLGEGIRDAVDPAARIAAIQREIAAALDR